MQVEIKIEATRVDVKPYLRVAAVSNEKSALSFLYVGTDNECIKTLSASFRSGLIAENFEEARKLIVSEDLNLQPVDAFIIDIPFSEKELAVFQSFVRNSGKVAGCVPFLYNEPHLKDLSYCTYTHLVDDVIDIQKWHYDFTSKISFLKKAKEQTAPGQEKIKASTCYYKRAFDIIVSGSLLLVALPIMLLIALVIRLESKGPIFYIAKRAGRGFKIFKFYKFRTMVVNADKKIDALAHLNQYKDTDKGPQFFKIANDPRVTKVGKFLRNTSLDEIPQLFNVLKGDMSLVGNRPLPLYEAATLTTNEFVERFMAPAGITGLWQIKKRGKADMSTEERINLDISYARKSNLLFDLWIMANTPKALLQKTDV